ncbi:MAG: SWIM zinc finger family protein [Acidimicrobiia bacterium]|nr:SWIM zinc finger family protein [Acidimicrobiia bacterium]
MRYAPRSRAVAPRPTASRSGCSCSPTTRGSRSSTPSRSRAAHAAALLDGDLEPGIVERPRAAGVELLPDAGHLQPRCSCPDWADPCKHAAAVCYLVADELDADPFALLELRGRRRDDVLAALRRRRAGSTVEGVGDDVADAGPAPDVGVVASECWGTSGAVAAGGTPGRAPHRAGRTPAGFRCRRARRGRGRRRDARRRGPPTRRRTRRSPRRGCAALRGRRHAGQQRGR